MNKKPMPGPGIALTALAVRLACAGLLGAGTSVASAQSPPSTTDLLNRIEQIQADSQRQIEALKKQVQELSDRQAATPPIDPGKVVMVGDEPGFIKVPGSENEFKLGGRLFVTGVNDFTGWTNGISAAPVPAPGSFAPNRIPVSGFSSAYTASSSVRGGTALQAWGSGIYAEVRRSTQYGPLYAFVGLDAVPPAQVPVNQSTSNNVTARLQRAYLTLGNWTVGQDFPNFTPSFRADTADPGPVPGIDWMLRSPQIRYAHNFSKQTQLRIALENPDSDVACYSGGVAGRYSCGSLPTATIPATVGNTARGNNGIGSPTRPVVSLKLEHTLPNQGGLLSAHAMVHQLKLDDGAGHRASANAYAFGVAGWLKVFGNDRVYGHAFRGNGLGHFSGDYAGYSGIYNGASLLELPKQASYMVGYRHYWTPALRSSVTYGVSTMGRNSILPLFTDGYVKKLEFAALNINWEVERNVNYFLEYDWGRRTMQQGDKSGIGRRLAGGLRYFF